MRGSAPCPYRVSSNQVTNSAGGWSVAWGTRRRTREGRAHEVAPCKAHRCPLAAGDHSDRCGDDLPHGPHRVDGADGGQRAPRDCARDDADPSRGGWARGRREARVPRTGCAAQASVPSQPFGGQGSLRVSRGAADPARAGFSERYGFERRRDRERTRPDRRAGADRASLERAEYRRGARRARARADRPIPHPLPGAGRGSDPGRAPARRRTPGKAGKGGGGGLDPARWRGKDRGVDPS